jgi:glycosyltransferase involved in cell wall biosynthesis
MNRPGHSEQTASDFEVSLLTGGGDKPYAFGLATALASEGVYLDFIGSDELDMPELRVSPRMRFFNLRGDQRDNVSLAKKIRRILLSYVRLIGYAFSAKPKIFHILWNNRFELLDRTLLMLYYKWLGKKVAFTAHNVNAGRRDSNDSLINRLTLRVQYRLADHIFVHTVAMKLELVKDFGVREDAISVVHIGVNNSVPDTDLTPNLAKARLGIQKEDRTILFFGHIGPYKGLEYLVEAFQCLVSRNSAYRLLIVGKPKVGSDKYMQDIKRSIQRGPGSERIMQRIEFIPDQDTEVYFKAADVLVLPYTEVFQSGVLVLGYTFGLPVIASAVGSLRDHVVEGETGFLCKPRDSADMAKTIDAYFCSDVFEELDCRRQRIRHYVDTHHSWKAVANTTRHVYERLTSSRS